MCWQDVPTFNLKQWCVSTVWGEGVALDRVGGECARNTENRQIDRQKGYPPSPYPMRLHSKHNQTIRMHRHVAQAYGTMEPTSRVYLARVRQAGLSCTEKLSRLPDYTVSYSYLEYIQPPGKDLFTVCFELIGQVTTVRIYTVVHFTTARRLSNNSETDAF